METYKQTLHSKMKLHHERHVYKRGMNKGDAPAGRRGKTHYLIIDRKDHMALRFWQTDVLKAYPDGSITIDCGGWGNRPTTKVHLNEWLWRNGSMYLGSSRIMSESQLVVSTPTSIYRYYDGISFDATGTPTTPLKPFLARRIDKDEVATLNQALEENGFKEMFKVLWGSVATEDCKGRWNLSAWVYVNDRTDLFAMPDTYASHWREIVANFAFDVESSFDHAANRGDSKLIKRTPSDTWSRIMEWVKTKMYNTIETEVYQLSK